MNTGVAGRLADAFLTSKLTPLILAGALGIGLYSVATMPSEEEPQIVVPLADIYIPLPGLSPEEVENRALIPAENVISGIEGVEYVYSHAEPGFGLVTVRFEVGRDMERSLVQLYATMMKHADRMPPGLTFPLVKTVSIDDVPFFTAVLSSDVYDPAALREIGGEVRVALEAVPNVRDVELIGGQPREVRVVLSPERLAALSIDPGHVVERLAAANASLEAGQYAGAREVVRVTAGPFLASGDDVARVVLDVRDGKLIQISDVARVEEGPAEVQSYTFTGAPGSPLRPMVALAVSKRPGADATKLGRRLEKRLESLRGGTITRDIDVRIARNYGETAREKVTTLKEHLVLAILAVGLVVALAMGWRAALVVMTAVPITFALTLFVYQLFGYSLNRVTLFALIFVTGIVIDDSIIVAENMERHFAMRDRPLRDAARAAVDEVGNPTILATLTVIAAVLPMLFVSGLMGPYMSPMPIGATLAMIFSLGVALIGTPWLAYRFLGRTHVQKIEAVYVLEDTRIYRIYRSIMEPLLDRPRRLWLALGGTVVLLLASTALFFTGVVTVKMLPFDDKSELQIIIDTPEGTSLEETADLTSRLGRSLAGVAEIEDVQVYVGTAAPFNFNGMIRHYYLRRGPTVADIQVNLVEKSDRSAKSHDVAKRVRTRVDETLARLESSARVKVAEVPPGPPVLSTLVAEVYADDDTAREAAALGVRELFETQDGVVDVDWSLRDRQRELRLTVDEEKAALTGVSKEQAVGALRAGLGGIVATHLSDPTSRESVPVTVRLGEGARSGVDRLTRLHVASVRGDMVPVSELVRVDEDEVPQVIDRKNGRRVVYVTADVAGSQESPVYAILDLKDEIGAIEISRGEGLEQVFNHQPESTERPVMKWDGEWQVTFEVFRDLGIAFAGALLIIYVLIVGWFGSFTTPLIMMTAIPLTLVGIAPGHWLFGAFFTATSMIGMIALAGIMVRNGILLIDYLESRIAEGVEIKQAIIEAGAVRTRPIALTAGTVVIGAFVILFDPIFEGLAVALIAGAIASTILTLIVVPGIYFLARRPRELAQVAEFTLATELTLAADPAAGPATELELEVKDETQGDTES